MCIPGFSAVCWAAGHVGDIGDIASGNPNNIVENAGLDIVNYFFQGFTDSVANAVADLMTNIATGWLLLPDANIAAAGGPVDQLRAHTILLTSAIAVGALLLAGIRLVMQRDGQEAGVLARGIAGLAVLTIGGVPVVMLLLSIGDLFSNWIVNSAADNDFKGKLADLIKRVASKDPSDTVVLTFIVLMILLFAALLQMVLFLARTVGLVLLTGLLPMAAAFGLSSGGQAVRRRYITWLITFVLYKPVAATIYAGAIWMMSKGDDFTTTFGGVVGICMAVVALPALMRLIAPAVTVGTASFASQGGLGRASQALSVANGAIAGIGALRRAPAAAAAAAPGGAAPHPPAPPVPPQPAPAGGGGGGGRGGGGAPALPAGGGGGVPALPPGGGGGGGGGAPAGGGGAAAADGWEFVWTFPDGRQQVAQGRVINGGGGLGGGGAGGGGGAPAGGAAAPAGGALPAPAMINAGAAAAPAAPVAGGAVAGGAAGGAAAGGAARAGAGAGGPLLAAAYLVATAPSTVVKKIGRTAASGIDEADY